MNLDDLLSIGCDVKLRLDDGTMPASSVALRMMSRVFSNALDAPEQFTERKPSIKALKRLTSRCSSTKSVTCMTIISLPGITKKQWLRIAEFLYPVVPFPTIKDWKEAEYLLEVGKKFELRLLLHKVDLYLKSRVPDMKLSNAKTQDSSWGWFKRADNAGLTVCLPAIAKRIRKLGKATCKSDKHLRGLSAAACRVLVKELAS